MNMTLEELSYGVAAISGAPVQDAAQMRYKAVWLQYLADELERKIAERTPEQGAPNG